MKHSLDCLKLPIRVSVADDAAALLEFALSAIGNSQEQTDCGKVPSLSPYSSEPQQGRERFRYKLQAPCLLESQAPGQDQEDGVEHPAHDAEERCRDHSRPAFWMSTATWS